MLESILARGPKTAGRFGLAHGRPPGNLGLRHVLNHSRVATALLVGAMMGLVGCQHPAMIAVANMGGNWITEYAVNANGNVAPVKISGNNTGLEEPGGIASDSVGSIRVGNRGSAHSITSYVAGASGDAVPIATIAGPNTGIGGREPPAVAVDGAGNIYATNDASATITIHARGDTGDTAPLATIAGNNTKLVTPTSIALDKVGEVYVVNFPEFQGTQTSVLAYPAGITGNVPPIAIIAGPHTGLTLPTGIAVDRQGAIYVAQKDGNVIVFPPGANGDTVPQRIISGSNTGLYRPRGIAVDNQGNIYVSNSCGLYADIECGQQRDDTIVIFGAGVNGNVAPNATITGSQTYLYFPTRLTIIPPDP